MRYFFDKCLFVPVLVLAACGGNDSSGTNTTIPPASYIGLFDLASTEKSDLGAHAIDSTAQSVSGKTGKFNRATGLFAISGLTGTISADRTSVVLDGGGTITIGNSGTTYVANYVAQPVGGNPTVGVVGVATHASHLPSGTANYAGSSILQIIDGTSVFDLTGGSTVNVNFGTGNVTIGYDALNGTRTDGISAPAGITNVGTLTISGAKISGNTFSGGTAVLASSKVASILSGSQLVSTSGGFFGNNAVEVGGVNLVNDTTGTGSLLIMGTFVGQ